MSLRIGLMLMTLAAAPALAQTPQPFPRPGSQPPSTTPAPPPARPQPAAPAAGQDRPQQPATPPATAPADPQAPTEAMLGLPIHPTAQFIASYDAGRGQRYYIFGAVNEFSELVNFYRTALKERGNFVFDQPPTHMFEVGRFNNDTMAFPPGVTIKDYTWAGSKGYPNPRRPASPERFPTIIMIVPAPSAATGAQH